MAQDGKKMADEAIAKSKKLLEVADKTSDSMKVAPAPPPKKSYTGMLSDMISKGAKKVGDALTPKPKPAGSGVGEEAKSAAEGIKAKADNVDQYNKANPDQPLKPYKKGGKVDKTGPAILDKGEMVLPTDKKKAEKLAMEHLGKKAGAMASAAEEEEQESPKKEKAEGKKGEKAEEKKDEKDDKPKHNFHRSEVVHHANGSHTTTHHHHPPKNGEVAKDAITYASPDFATMISGMHDNVGGGQAVGPQQAGPQATPAPEPGV